MKIPGSPAVFASLALGCVLSADAQAQGPRRESDIERAERSQRLGRAAYRTGNLRLPGTRDPLDHSAFLEVGFFRDSESAAGVDTSFVAVPMQLGLDLPVGDHFQLRGRFGLAGAVQSTEAAGMSERDRAFRPGNLELGASYAMGGGDTHDGLRWTLYAGGSVIAPTAQVDEDASAAEAGLRAAAYAGALGVHGLENPWIFVPESWGFVPRAAARVVYGPVFANASVDLGMLFSTDDAERVNYFQFRVEAGYRSDDVLRVGLGFTDVLAFGPGVGSGDSSQAALRLFLRADLQAITIGEEFVINLGDPFGNSFETGGVWGLVTTVGLSL